MFQVSVVGLNRVLILCYIPIVCTKNHFQNKKVGLNFKVVFIKLIPVLLIAIFTQQPHFWLFSMLVLQHSNEWIYNITVYHHITPLFFFFRTILKNKNEALKNWQHQLQNAQNNMYWLLPITVLSISCLWRIISLCWQFKDSQKEGG
jgi:hypothetical protein